MKTYLEGLHGQTFLPLVTLFNLDQAPYKKPKTLSEAKSRVLAWYTTEHGTAKAMGMVTNESRNRKPEAIHATLETKQSSDNHRHGRSANRKNQGKSRRSESSSSRNDFKTDPSRRCQKTTSKYKTR